MQAPGVCSYGGSVPAADWQGNAINVDESAPLTQVSPVQ